MGQGATGVGDVGLDGKGRVLEEEVAGAGGLGEVGDAVGSADDHGLVAVGLVGEADARLEVGGAVVLVVEGGGVAIYAGDLDVAGEEAVVGLLIVSVGAGVDDFVAEAEIEGEVGEGVPVVCSESGVEVVTQTVVGAVADGDVGGQAEEKVGFGEAGGGGGTAARLGDNDGGIAGEGSVEGDLPGEAGVTDVEDVGDVAIALEAEVDGVLAVDEGDGVFDLSDGVVELLDEVVVAEVGGVEGSGEEHLGEEGLAGCCTGDAEDGGEILAGGVGVAEGDGEVAGTETEVVKQRRAEGMGVIDDTVVERIGVQGVALQGEAVIGGAADSLLGVAAVDVIFLRGYPVDLEVALIGVGRTAGEIDLIVGQVAVDGLWVQGGVEDAGGSGADVAGDLVVEEGEAASRSRSRMGIVELLGEVIADALSIEAGGAESGEVTFPLGCGQYCEL